MTGKLINDGVRFLLEIATVALLIMTGWRGSVMYRLVWGIGLPAVAVLFWARYMVPHSPHQLTVAYRILAELVIFGGTTLFVTRTFGPRVAIPYGIIALVNTVLTHTLSA